MAADTNQFLKFSAYSIKDAITRRLAQDTKFTDEVYEGSNLAILIDLVSYMYQVLVYQLNNAASESMFSDSQIFENISRIVSLIGYHPKGCAPASFNAYIKWVGSDTTPPNLNCFPYTRIDTGRTDSAGKKVFFSTKRYGADEGIDNEAFEEDLVLDQVMYNGQWKVYSTVFTASGVKNETFSLDGVGSDSEQQKYVADGFIDVYVQTEGELPKLWTNDSDGVFTRSKNVSTITVEETTFYKNTDEVYTLSLNQNRDYEIKFGDGTIGKKLKAGDRVIAFYLDTNGPDGEVDLSDIDFSGVKLEHSAAMFGLNEDTYS